MTNQIQKLLSVIDTLLSPDGCPWDRKQSIETLTPMILEEASEAMDALSEKDMQHYADELGDLFITAFFACKFLEKQEDIAWDAPFVKGAEKLIRRHPHIFGDKNQQITEEEVVVLWDDLKKTEGFHKKKTAISHEIPQNLPIVAKLQKLASLAKKRPELEKALETCLEPSQEEGEKMARQIMQDIVDATEKKIDVESSLRELYSEIIKKSCRKRNSSLKRICCIEYYFCIKSLFQKALKS